MLVRLVNPRVCAYYSNKYIVIPVKRNELADDRRVVEILTEAFSDNQSVNYVIKQDSHRLKRIRRLMQYAVATCHDFGEVWLSDDRNACALTVLSDRKRSTAAVMRRDVQLAFLSTGLSNVYRTLRREAQIKAAHPDGPFCHLWFVGVATAAQGQGKGSQLLKTVIDHHHAQLQSIYLETSTQRNLPWYQRFGFEVYGELNFSYPLYLLRSTTEF